MTTILIGLISLAVHAAPADHVARLFRVEKGGRASYVLANLEAYRLPANAKVGLLRRAIVESCEFVMLADPRRPPLKVPIPDDLRFQRPFALLGALSPNALGTIKHLLRGLPDDLPHYVSMRPGVALEYLKALFVAERQRRLYAYHRAIVQGEMPPAARLDGRLVAAATTLWGDHVTLHGLLTTMLHYLLEHEARVPESVTVSLDEFVLSVADDPRVTTLASADRILDELDLVTDADLERFLRSVRDALDNLSADVFWDSVLIAMLDDELVRRYFTLPAADFAKLYELVHGDRPALNESMPGEERKRRARANAHEAWVPTIVDKISAGGAFVSVAGGHVVPGLEPLAHWPLLDELRARGFNVEPLVWSP